MNDDVEAQVRRQAERDREIELKIARLVRRRRLLVAVGMVLFAAVVGGLVFLGIAQLSAPPPDPRQHLAKAAEHEKRGELQEASNELKRVLQLTPDDGEARFRLGQIYVDQGDGKAGEKEIRQARVLGFQTEGMNPLLLKSMLLQRRYTEVLIETIGLTGGSDHEAVGALEGEAQLGLKQLDKARATYEGILATNPTSRPALLGLARVHIAESDPERSLEQAGRVLASAPDDAEALLLQGIANLYLGRLDEARASLQAPILSGHPEAEIALSQSYLGQGDTATARTHLTAASRAGKTSTMSYLTAVASFQDGDVLGARNTLRDLLDKDPSQLDGWYLMAWLNVDGDELRQGESSLVRLLEASPGDLSAAKLLATVYFDLGQPADALQVLAPMEQSAQGDGQWLALMARAHLLNGDAAQAQVFLDRAPTLRGGGGEGDAAPPHPTSSWRLDRCRILVNFCRRCSYTRECL